MVILCELRTRLELRFLCGCLAGFVVCPSPTIRDSLKEHGLNNDLRFQYTHVSG